MKKIIFFIVVTFFSLEFYSAPYEDEVRKSEDEKRNRKETPRIEWKN